MGKRTVEIITDDLTGAELSENVEPTIVTFDGKKYSLYLSATSATRFHDFLEGNAPLIPASAPRATTRASTRSGTLSSEAKEQQQQIRKWAQDNEVANKNGKVPGPRGRLAAEVVDKFFETHPGAVRLI